MPDVTTIQLRRTTREALRRVGRKGESYDALILRLLEAAQRVRFFEEMDRIVETEEFMPLDKV